MTYRRINVSTYTVISGDKRLSCYWTSLDEPLLRYIDKSYFRHCFKRFSTLLGSVNRKGQNGGGLSGRTVFGAWRLGRKHIQRDTFRDEAAPTPRREGLLWPGITHTHIHTITMRTRDSVVLIPRASVVVVVSSFVCPTSIHYYTYLCEGTETIRHASLNRPDERPFGQISFPQSLFVSLALPYPFVLYIISHRETL